ncbi:hypothetical protein GCM10020000_77460 [Streptomyces olivoverticillatus]
MPRVPVIGSGDATGPGRSASAPIFDELAARWAAAGRAVPGRDDPEWTRLVRQAPWPDRLSGGAVG